MMMMMMMMMAIMMMMMMMMMVMLMIMMMMTGTSTVQFDGSNQMTIDRRQEIAAEAQDITLRCETVIITIILIVTIVIIITIIIIITVIVTFKSRYHTRFKSRNHPACHYLIHCDIWFTIIITIGVLIISSLHQSTFITYGYTNTCVA